MTRLKTLTLSILTGLLALQAAALPGDRDLAIRGKAHKTTLDGNSGQTTLTGSVVITQGALSIYADEVIFRRDPETQRITYLKATGQPARFIDTPTENQPPVEMRGTQIEYFPDDNTIITFGEAELQQNDNQASGERIEYNTESGVMVIESARLLRNDDSAPQAEFTLQPETLD